MVGPAARNAEHFRLGPLVDGQAKVALMPVSSRALPEDVRQHAEVWIRGRGPQAAVLPQANPHAVPLVLPGGSAASSREKAPTTPATPNMPATPNTEAEAVRVLQDLLRAQGGECDVSVLIQQLGDKHPALKAAAGIKKPRAWLEKCGGGGLFILGPANQVLAARPPVPGSFSRPNRGGR